MAETPVERFLDADVSVESVEAVHDLLASWWPDLGDLDTRVRFAFETAVVEIAGNIVEHTRTLEAATGRRFTLVLSANADLLTATFEDNGLPAGVDLSAVTMADVDDEGGRGLALTLASIDVLDYRYRGGRNIWRLECRRR
jgi:serine/threonine-protein kinase RsbW